MEEERGKNTTCIHLSTALRDHAHCFFPLVCMAESVLETCSPLSQLLAVLCCSKVHLEVLFEFLLAFIGERWGSLQFTGRTKTAIFNYIHAP